MNNQKNHDKSGDLSEKIQNRRFAALLIFGALAAAGALIIGSILRKRIPELPQGPFWIAATVCMVLPLLLFAIMMIVKKSYVKKRNADRIKDVIASLLRQREKAVELSSKGPGKLARIRGSFRALAIATALCGLFLAFLAGVAGTSSSNFYLFFFFSSVYIVTGTMVFLPMPSLAYIENEDMTLKRDDYPHLYGIAEKARLEIGIEGRVLILAEASAEIGISYRKDVIFLKLGMLIVNDYSDDELYAVLLHEFAHLKEDPKERRERLFMEKLSTSLPSSPVFALLFRYYALPVNVYYYHFVLYDYAVSVIREQEADAAMLRCGDRDAAASALIKLFFYERYDYEGLGDAVNCRTFEGEEPPRDLCSRFAMHFIEAAKERRADWLSMIDREIMARSSTHPTVKMRLEALGADRYDLPEKKPSDKYRHEMDRLLALLDERIFQKDPEGYKTAREESYLKALETVTGWEDQGKPLVAEEYRQVLDALLALGRNAEAEELCDRAIEELPPPAAPTAHLVKGQFLLRRYDEAGVDHIYKAIEDNSNNIEDGLSLIGRFCCYTGNAELLETYRERAVNYAQFVKDEYAETGVLRKSDDLSRERLPDGALEAFLDHLSTFEDGSVEKIYLLHKKISENFFTSAFIVKYAEGIDPKKRREVEEKIFEYLDTSSDWQYSLFDYENVAGVKPERIEGSLVYDKNGGGRGGKE